MRHARDVDFQAVAEELARRKLIRPSTTRGFLSDVQPHQVTYDAQTAAGGRGGPLFDERGRVIAVNLAVLQRFPGANYGVPIRLALDLLEQPATTTARWPVGSRTSDPSERVSTVSAWPGGGGRVTGSLREPVKRL